VDAAKKSKTALILDGELTNADELSLKYRNILPDRTLRPPELCLQLITRHGPEIAEQFNGSFIIALFDSVSNELTLVSDRLGFRPLFIVDHGSEFIFATEMKGLLAAENHAPKFDELGVLELFCYKTHVYGRTWIEGHYRLAPATILTVGPDNRRERTYWTYQYREDAARLDQATYSTVYAKLVDRCVDRAMRGGKRIGIFLSGGYDSRAIAAAIRPHHIPLPAFTFGDAAGRDVKYAALIAERLGFNHHVIHPVDLDLYRNAASIAWRTEGMSPFANTTSIAHHDVFKEHMDIILAGFLGEFSGSHVWPAIILARTRQAVIDAIFQRFAGANLGKIGYIFNRSFLQRTVERMKAEFNNSFETIDNDNPLNIADVWNFRFFHPQETYHAPAIDRHMFEVRTPLTDMDLVNFLLTVPPSARIEHRIYKKMIAYSYPEVRDIPCTNSGKPIDPYFSREYLKMGLRYIGRKISQPVTRLSRRSVVSNREFRNLAEDFRAEPELQTRLLIPMLENGIFSEQIFDLDAVRSMVDAHYNRKGDHETTLSNLIGWGLAVKSMIHGDKSDISSDLLGS